MSLRSERNVVQQPLIRYAIEAGWTYLSRDDALRLRRGETNPILCDTFIQKVQSLNPGFVDHLKAEDITDLLIRVPPNIEGNFQAWEYLKGLKTVFVESEKRERNVRLIDFDNPTKNVFNVTDEFGFTNGVKTIRADIIFLINDIPVIIIETKAATRSDGIAEGLDQIRRYHREGPELAVITQLFSLTHMIHYFYGATWNLSTKNLFNWKEENAGKDFETLVKTFFAPERILRILRDFILFTRKDDELQKVVLRPHQMRAVERALVRAHDPNKRRGLIWHTQGSGKTYTMITIAKRLVEDPVFNNPTVLMLVDRTELETQLFGNLAAVGLGTVEVAASKEKLRELLGIDTRGIIVSMIHKFDDIPAKINMRSNIFVLVDEAHRTTGGDLGNYLMGALPNATYLGFTGTPVDKTAYGKGTFKVFGIDDPNGYLDKYSIAESVEDGTTVPLYYSLAPNELRVDRQILEKEFLNLVQAEGVSDIEELNRVLDKSVNLKNMLKNRERVQRVAQYIAKHFLETVEPLGYKAFIVGVDREACCLLKEALDKYLPTEYSKVVISPGHNDPPELARYHLSDQEEKDIRKAFIKPESLPKILIVTEKLLTGYDAPVLYCMYLDKPMRDHVLLQAIARVNRPYENENGARKPGGFVLDFVGIFENLEKALAFDSKDVQSVIEGLDVLRARFSERIAKGRADYLKSVTGKSADKAAEAALELFRDENRRQEFYGYFRELEDLYEILSPDDFLRGFIEDYHGLADLYALLRSAYDNQGITDRELARKTASLVQAYTQAGVIHNAVAVQEITPQTLSKINQSTDPDTVKVFNLLKSISHKVKDEGGRTPYLFSIGERAEAIAEAFKQRQSSTEEALKQLEAIIKEINDAEREQAERGISGEAFATFWILKQSGIATTEAETVAGQMNNILKQFPYWHTSDEQSRHIRRRLYTVLEQAKIKDIPKTAEKIMTVIARK
jgi:type I restriction enzyme R subunit